MDAFQKLLQSQDGADAMKLDSVRPETIVIFEKTSTTREDVRAWPVDTLADAVALVWVLAPAKRIALRAGALGMPNRHA